MLKNFRANVLKLKFDHIRINKSCRPKVNLSHFDKPLLVVNKPDEGRTNVAHTHDTSARFPAQKKEPDLKKCIYICFYRIENLCYVILCIYFFHPMNVHPE